MPSLYVSQPGAKLEIEYERLLVTIQDEVITRIPIANINQIIIIGQAGMTTPAIHSLLYRKIPVFFLNRAGSVYGGLLPNLDSSFQTRKQQYGLLDDERFKQAVSREQIAAKIHNQRVIASRLHRSNQLVTPKDLAALSQLRVEAEEAATIEVLRGIEGTAARIYFDTLSRVIPIEWHFNDRNRRPPRDPVNAMLSFGYSLLVTAMCGSLQLAGLDPYAGYLHSPSRGKPALALDLMEEFRAPVVDAMVIAAVHNHRIHTNCFSESSEGCLLNEKGRRIVTDLFIEKINQPLQTKQIRRAISYQKHFEVQARHLKKSILHPEIGYRGFRIR
jgi:CRISPR-associated protein Cas1